MRKPIVIFCAVVLISCFWLLLHQKHEPEKNKQPEVQAALTNQQSASQSFTTFPEVSQISSIPKPPPAVVAEAKYRSTPEGSNAFQQRVLADWQRPIEFYGKVIDENTNPVAGASITFGWSEFPTEEGARRAMTISDANGLFSLQGERGPSLDVAVSKIGYYASHNDKTGFSYMHGDFSPSVINPVIFHLHKKGKGESLIQKKFPPGMGQIWQLHHDGTPIELDLLNGSQNVTGIGQMKFEFWRDISDLNKQPFDWRLQLSILGGGGLIPTEEEFAFQAPESGYQPSIVIDMPATNQNWLGEVRTKYYIQLPNGNYGRIDFYLLPYNGVFTVGSSINPSGSRNLEPSQ